MSVVDCLLGNFRWYRKARGGRWQYEINMAIPHWGWFRVELFEHGRMSICRSVTKREDWRR